MLVRKQQAAPHRPSSSELNALAGHAVFCSEFKYRRGTEIFGEAEPTEYLYQVKSGAVRSYKLLADGRRQIMAICRVTSSASRTVQFTGLPPKQSSKRLFA